MADINLEQLFGGVGTLTNQIAQNTQDIATMKPIVNIAYTPNNKPTPAAIGAVNKAGDTMTGVLTANGGITITENKEINFTRNTDWFKMGFKNDSDADTDSFGYIEMGDNGNEYFKFRSKSGATTTDLLTIKTDHLRFKGNAVYHAGYKPTAADVGALPITGGTMTGMLTNTANFAKTTNQSHIFHNCSGTTNTESNIRSMRESSGATWLWEKVGAGSLWYSTGTNGGGQNKVKINVSTGEIYLENANRRVYHEGFKPTAADVGAIPINVKTYSNAPLLTRTANYFDDSSLRNLDYSGFYRANGLEVDGKSLPSLMIHCPHSSGKAHARGIGFGYGSGWDTFTYRFDAQGVYQGVSKIYHEQNKPTPAEINAVNRDQVNFGQTGTWAGVVGKIPTVGNNGVMEIGKYIDFHDTNSTADYDIRVSNSGNTHLNIQSANGTIEIGAKNTSYAHIYTDRSQFAFNKGLKTFEGYGFAVESANDPRIELHKPGAVAYAMAAAGNGSFELWQSNGGGGWVKTLLRVQSDGYFWCASNGDFNDVYIRSDKRLKSNIHLTTNHLEKIMQLKPVVYDKKKTLEDTETEREIGLIAQDVEEIIPLAVSTTRDELEMKALKPYALISTLIGAIKEQQEQLNNLTTEIKKLKGVK